MRYHVFAILVALATFAPAQIARAAAPISPEAAAWLDRAVAEFPAVREEERQIPGKLHYFDNFASDESLTKMLFECRKTEVDRARLLETARRIEKRPPDGDSLLERFGPLSDAAYMYASAGAKDDARRLLRVLEQMRAQVKPVESGLSIEGIVIPMSVMIVRMRIGDLTDADLNQLGADELVVLIEAALEDGRQADVLRYTALLLQAAADISGKRSGHSTHAAVKLATCGQMTAAHELANILSATSGDRADALAEIARVRYKTGDSVGAREDAALALKAARDANDDKRRGALLSMVREASAIGDKGLIEESADAFVAELARSPSPREGIPLFYYVDAARAYAAARLRFKFNRAAATAEAQISRFRPEQQPAHWIEVAEAYARADDREKVDAAITRAKAIGPVPDYERSYFGFVAIAYAEAGDFKNAMRLLDDYLPKAEAQATARSSIAGILARAGRYGEAEMTGDGMPDAFNKLKIHRLIVIERIRTKQTTRLAEWIAAHPSARERAVLYLAAAQQLLGKEGQGTTPIFEVR